MVWATLARADAARHQPMGAPGSKDGSERTGFPAEVRLALVDHNVYEDAYVRHFLEHTKTIAIVGASDDPARPSYEVMSFLLGRGYRISAINPKLVGGTILNVPVFGTLADVPDAIGMVDVFRNNAAVPGVVDEVLALPRRPRFIWMQIGVRDDEAAKKAEAAGIEVIMDRCPKIEILRLSGRP